MTKSMICLLFTLFALQLRAYESGFEDDTAEVATLADSSSEVGDAVDCLAELEQAVANSPVEWNETHCKKTAQKIIALFNQKGILEEADTACADLDDFRRSPMGEKLLSDSPEAEHQLFSVNVCGSAHVLVVEKRTNAKESWCRIFQSWQREINLAQWLGMAQCNNEKFRHDFAEFGRGKKISCEYLGRILTEEVRSSQDRIQRFREFGLGVPLELVVTRFNVRGREQAKRLREQKEEQDRQYMESIDRWLY